MAAEEYVQLIIGNNLVLVMFSLKPIKFTFALQRILPDSAHVSSGALCLN